MRLWGVFRKSLREQSRDLWLLVLTVATAPFFVLLYWLFFPQGSTTYNVLVINEDVAVQIPLGGSLKAGDLVVEALKGVTYADGSPILKVVTATGRAAAEERLKNRDAAALLVIPAEFSRAALAAYQTGAKASTGLTIVGDLTNPQYAVVSTMVNAAVFRYVQTVAGQESPVQLTEEALGGSAARSEFENYVPGLLILSVVMLIFQAAMAVAREVEAGTLLRLQLTRMTAFDLLGGISAAQMLVGVGGVVLTFLTAWAFGFRSHGPLWVAMVVGAVTSLSIVGVGLVVASFSRTVTEAFLIGNLPLMLLMFFSGAIYPLPRVPLFDLGGHSVGLYDVLPPTHAVVALNKVLTLGAGLGEVVYEVVALLLLSAFYFAAGIWLFNRLRLRAAR